MVAFANEEQGLWGGRAYAEAGASGFFVPGLVGPDLIGLIAAVVPLPLNVMAVPGGPDRAAFPGAGVARISHGPFPYRRMLAWLAAEITG